MCPPKPQDKPSRVAAEDGEVLIDGPNGLALSLTPEATEETSHRLLDGAARALGQKGAGQRRTARPESRGQSVPPGRSRTTTARRSGRPTS
jgi:hypothetical protein